MLNLLQDTSVCAIKICDPIASHIIHINQQHSFAYVLACKRTYTDTYIATYTHTYIHSYIHTYVHTYTRIIKFKWKWGSISCMKCKKTDKLVNRFLTYVLPFEKLIF